MHVGGLWRYPVKSLQGEALDAVDVEADGLRHDRAWGIRSCRTGLVLTARRCPEMLFASARIEDGQPLMTLPDGTTRHGAGPGTDRALSDWLGQPVELVAAAGVPASAGEYFADATDDTSPALQWTMPPGRFVDALPILLVTDGTLRRAAALHRGGHWDVRRFRPNILAVGGPDGWAEDAWLQRSVTIGDAVTIVPQEPCQRCTMVTRPQPGLDGDLDIYRTVLHHHDGALGVWSTVARPGPIRLHDAVDVA
jgi:uncharacterized protein YcbX